MNNNFFRFIHKQKTSHYPHAFLKALHFTGHRILIVIFSFYCVLLAMKYVNWHQLAI